MTDTLAIKIITKQIDQLADARSLMTRGTPVWQETNNEIKALLKALEALEEVACEAEEPVSFTYEDWSGDKHTGYECPKCRKPVSELNNPFCCGHCGKPLIWNKEDSNGSEAD